ncbi:hypothetical protein [Nonomuraea sp. NPDC049695]|uniref:hypothetical protein n=1 Tax=Nonomuraea sp. NPDC049695 TaxID=3154734 RepID=UPI00343A34C0
MEDVTQQGLRHGSASRGGRWAIFPSIGGIGGHLVIGYATLGVLLARRPDRAISSRTA